MTAGYLCQVCASAALEVVDGYGALPRVTSDAKPWPSGGTLTVCTACGAIQKLPDQVWLREAKKIYDDYEMYYLSDGAEQLVFTSGGDAQPRSRQLIEYLVASAALPENGRVLDIGCGNGAALAEFAQMLPRWRLYGSEITERSLHRLRRLENFVRLFTEPPSQIAERFNVATMIHSLEHMPSPRAMVADAVSLLCPGGVLFIEVPDIEASPFDLLVADHLMHFSSPTLALLVARAGLRPAALVTDVVPKEITLLARAGESRASAPDPKRGVHIARTTVAWLQEVLSRARALAAENFIGIFGTAIAAMALYGALRDHVSFFVDEDPMRIGRHYDGKPVLAPANIPEGSAVFVALPPQRAQQIADRLSDFPVRFVLPPDRE
jgi:2-polyprenyl-3-methyl-5-hydroxy-6-metoxy-1,4-benzoquinol methylase